MARMGLLCVYMALTWHNARAATDWRRTQACSMPRCAAVKMMLRWSKCVVSWRLLVLRVTGPFSTLREREREREGETRDFIRSPCPETAGRSCLCLALPTTCAVLVYSSFVGHPRLYLCLCNHTPALAPIFCHISPFHPPHPSLPCLFNAEQRSSCLSAQTCHELTKLIALREAMIADHGQVGPGRLTEEGAAVQSRGGGGTIEERMRCR